MISPFSKSPPISSAPSTLLRALGSISTLTVAALMAGGVVRAEVPPAVAKALLEQKAATPLPKPEGDVVRVKTGEEEVWTPIFTALNLPLVKEFSEPIHWAMIDRLLDAKIYETVGTPVAGELYLAERSQTKRRT